MAAPQSSPLPVAPQRNEAEADFTQKANAFVSALEPFRQELQVQADFVNDEVDQFDANLTQAVADATQTATDARDTAVSAAASASQDAADAEVFRNESEAAKDAALSLVNFAGKWADLTGALNTPATVFHQGAYWRLLNDLADVTASEPANDNADWLFVYSNAELRRKLLDEATLYADFVNGDYRLYEGVGAGVVRNKAFGDLFSFTRASDATGQGVSTLETVSADVARFVCSPELKKRQGLLIEDQQTNLLLWSEAFDNASWVKKDATVVSNAEISPDGLGNADALIPTTISGTHRISRSYTLTQGDSYSPSIRVKKRGYNYAFLSVGGVGASFNLNSGEVVYVSPDAPGFMININAKIKKVKKGFFRITLEFKADTSIATAIRVGCNASDANVVEESFAGDGVSGICIWGAQSNPGSYIKTEGSQSTRSSDNCSRALGTEYDSDEITLFAEFVAEGNYSEKSGCPVALTDGGALDQYLFVSLSESEIVIQIKDADSIKNIPTGVSAYKERNNFVAVSVSRDVIYISVNGALTIHPLGASLDQISDIRIGRFAANPAFLNSSVGKVAMKPSFCAPAELIALTQPEAE